MTANKNLLPSVDEALVCQPCDPRLCIRGIAIGVRDSNNTKHNEALRSLLRLTGGKVVMSAACGVEGCENSEIFGLQHYVFDPLS